MTRARRRRRKVAAWIGAGVLGLALLALASPWTAQVVMPGELAPPHATLADRCDLCHTNATGIVARGLRSLGDEHFAAGPVSNDQCIACHDRGARALSPHSVDPEAFRVHDLRAEGSPIVELAHPWARHDELSCVLCHREHRGEEASLTTFTNAQCQACHAQRFASFNAGHPAFESYPFEKPQRIAFDHDRHFAVHFADEAFAGRAPQDCRSCHAPTPDGRDMLVGSYENTCAACHADDIRGVARATAPGIPFLALPAMDVTTLRARGMEIGTWPADARMAETGVTPFLRLLLSTEPDAGQRLDVLGQTNLLDLSQADEAQLQAATWLTWATRGVLQDIAQRGHEAVAERVERALHRELTADEAAALLAGLPGDTLAAAIDRWLPQLESELQAHRAGRPIPARSDAGAGESGSRETRASDAPTGDLLGERDDAGDDLLGDDLLAGGEDEDPFAPALGGEDERSTPAAPGDAWVAFGGWHLSEADWGLHYRPAGHGDAFMKAWIDGAASTSRRDLLDVLALPQSPGACVKCHVRTDAGVAWRSATRAPGDLNWRPWTHFAHGPHLSLMAGDEGCRTCHVPLESTRRVDGLTAFHSFDHMRLDQCTTCHQPEQAGTDCLQCHNYHVGSFERMGASPLR